MFAYLKKIISYTIFGTDSNKKNYEVDKGKTGHFRVSLTDDPGNDPGVSRDSLWNKRSPGYRGSRKGKTLGLDRQKDLEKSP